jgi:glycerophosphoryl diester phosphodiesterase
MKYIYLLLCFFSALYTSGQVKMHAHNDYEKPLPLFNALKNKAFSIEADIFSRNGQLLVAHNANQLPGAKTLNELYIQPIIQLYKKNKGRISEDKDYRIVLMVDVKEGGEETIRQLAELLKANRNAFDRSKNPNAVQVIVSGDRGEVKNWASFPPYIFFDGRPTEQYDHATLKRVALISDSYSAYAENKEKLTAVLEKAHQAGKLFRFWGTPDNEFSWKYFKDAGVDIINTDKPDLCRKFLDKEKSGKLVSADR